MSHTHASYVLRAGGECKALADLKVFYSAKYACIRRQGEDSELALAIVIQHCSGVKSEEISPQELTEVFSIQNPKKAKALGKMELATNFASACADVTRSGLC